MDNDALIWLHLSDIHFGQGKTDGDHIDQSIVCAEILRDVAEVMGQVGPPDWIFVTGDVAYKGDTGEYSLAYGWLDELARTVGVGREKILITPGNHDVDRRKATDNFRRRNTHRALRNEPRELDDCLADDEARDDLWEKLRAYADFARAFGPKDTALDAGKPWWVHPYASPLGEVCILGLNTALLSIDDLDKDRIALGKRQIKSIPDQDTPGGNLLVVLQHHPWDWLHDGAEQRRWLGTRPHLFFCGHIHQPEGIVGLRLDGQSHVLLVAGAGHGEAGEPPSHGYAWGRLTRNGLDYLPRLWSDRHKRFQADRDNFQERMDAQGMIHVPGDRLPPKLQAWLEAKKHPQPPVSRLPARPSNPHVDELLQDYLDSLRNKCDRLPVASIDPQSGFANTFHLSDIYEELDAKPMRLGNDTELKTHKLIDAIANPEYRFTVLRGGVGSGKSAFVNHLGHCLSGTGGTSPALKDSIPVVVALGGSLETIQTYSQKARAGLAWALVERAFYQCLDNDKADIPFHVIRRRLAGEGYFMFDGLDEMPEGHARKRVLEALEDFAHELAERGQSATNANSSSLKWQAQKLNPNVAFDVFLSHNSQDKPIVRELALALESCGLRVWLDEKQLVPGRPWQEALEKIIQTTGTAAVLIGKSGFGPWENPEMRACLAEFVSRELPVIPVLLPDAPKGLVLPLFLKSFTWVDLRTGLDSGGLEKLVWGITGVKPESAPGSPGGKSQPSVARILVTTRPYALADVKLARFKTLDLPPLNGEQIDRFAERWYRELQKAHYWSNRDTAAKIASLRLAVGPHSDLKELASQPLLLTLIASLHSRLSRLPDNRADLYGAVVR